MRSQPQETGQLPRQPLAGRNPEIRIFGSALDASRNGFGQVVVVSGDAATGKSRLLEEFKFLAREAGVRVATARGSSMSADLPYDAAMQLLGSLVDRSDRKLDELIRSIESRSGHADVSRLMHTIRLTLLQAAGREPLALIVDRGELLDDASAKILEYLAHGIDDLAVLLVVAARQDGAGRDITARLLDSPRSARIGLGPLTPDGVHELVRTHPIASADDPFLEHCMHLTRGYPDLVQELLDELRRRRLPETAASLDDVAKAPLPGAARAAAAAMKTSNVRERRMASAVLLLGPSVGASVIAGMLKANVDDLAEIGDPLASAGLLGREEATGMPALAIRAPLTERALYAAISAKAMTETRRLAARVLVESGASPEAAARHLLDTVPTGRLEVVELMHAAGRRALSAGRPADAVAFLGRAMSETSNGDVAPEIVFDLLTAEAVLVGPQAIDAHAGAVARLADSAARVAAWERLGGRLLAAGYGDLAAEAFDRGLKELGPEADVTKARSRLSRRYADAAMEAPGLAERARTCIVDQLRDADVFEPALGVRLAAERVMAGQPAHTALELARWSVESDLLTDRSPEAVDATTVLIQVLTWCEQYEEAEEITRRILMAVDPAGRHAPALEARLAAIQLLRGCVADAAASARSALAAAHRQAVAVLPLAASVLASAELEAGAGAAAERAITQAREAVRGATGIYHLVEVEGWIAFDAGDSRQALELFLEARRLAAEAAIFNPALTGCEHGAVAALVRMRRTSEALELSASLLERSRRFGTPRVVASALRASARAVPFDQALAMLDEAVHLVEESPARLEHARCLTARGAVLRRLNRRNDARECLRAALDAAHRAGADRLAARAHEELLAAGARPRRRLIAGRDSLTPAEQRVAALAVLNHTNREIADALFLTVKTVEWHLHNVFSKLVISSRRQIEDALRHQDSPPPVAAAVYGNGYGATD